MAIVVRYNKSRRDYKLKCSFVYIIIMKSLKVIIKDIDFELGFSFSFSINLVS